MKSLTSNLKNFAFAIAGEKYHDFLVLLFAWPDIVGDIQAQRTQLIRYEKHILYVQVINHVWRQDLFNRKSFYIEEIKAKTSIDIHDIKFFI